MANFKPKIGDKYYYYKPCGVICCEEWKDHPIQNERVGEGRAPFATASDAGRAYFAKKI